MIVDPDLARYKLETPSGSIYFFAELEHLTKALIEGKLTQMSSYQIKDGRFIKNRTVGVEIPNMLINMGREEVNKFFDFMEKNR